MNPIFSRQKRKNRRFTAIFLCICTLFTAFALSISLFAAEETQKEPSAETQVGTAQTDGEGRGDRESEEIPGIRIPREIVLGIVAAAVIGGSVVGYRIARRKK